MTLAFQPTIEDLEIIRRLLENKLFEHTVNLLLAGTRSLREQGAVLGVGVGAAPQGSSDVYALYVYVSDQSALSQVPSQFEGLVVITEIVGEFTAAAVRERRTLTLPQLVTAPPRPTAAGGSVGSVALN